MSTTATTLTLPAIGSTFMFGRSEYIVIRYGCASGWADQRRSGRLMEPGVGVEPTTPSLRVTCSTTELTGRPHPTYPPAQNQENP
jgi:hypothetical protein